MNKIRIAHIIASLEIGGAELVVYNNLMHFDADGANAIVICLKSGGYYYRLLKERGFRVFVLDGKMSFLSRIMKTRDILISQGINVVHSHNFTGGSWGRTAAILARVPHVFHTEHNVIVRSKRFHNFLSSKLSIVTDKIIAVSDKVGESIAEAHGIPVRKIITIHNGIEVGAFSRVSKDRAEMLEGLGISDRSFVVGTVGSLTPQKNHRIIIEMADAIRGSDENIHFVIVGEGVLRKELESLVRKKGLGHAITFTGERTDIPELLNSFDVFLLPSDWEGFPITILEAMDAGKPIIATDVGGNREAIQDGRNGFLCKPADATDMIEKILRLKHDRNLADELGESAKKTVSREFSSSIMARETQNLYRSFCAFHMKVPDEKIKVLYLIESLDTGGAERQLYELVRSLDKRRYQPYVCTFRSGGKYYDLLRKAGYGVKSLNKRTRVGLLSTLKLVRLISLTKPAILHTYLNPANLRGALVGGLKRIPIIITSVRNIDDWKRGFHFALDRVISPLIDKTVCNAQAIIDFESTKHNIPKSRYRLIYNGVSPAFLKEPVSMARPAEDNGFIIGNVGSLTDKKDHFTFVRAAELIRERVKGCEFCIIGKGPLEKEINHMVQSKGLSGCFKILYCDNDRDIMEIVDRLHLVVQTSLREGCSNVILEAMARGKPVIATDVGGNKEIVINNETGMIVPKKDFEKIADGVCLLHSNRSLYESMATLSRRRIEEYFPVSNMVKKTQELYETLLCRKGVKT